MHSDVLKANANIELDKKQKLYAKNFISLP